MSVPDPIPEGREGRWYALALHSHSRYSDGRHPIAKLVEKARAAGLDGLAISDHNCLRQTLDAYFRADDMVLFPSEEWTSPQGPHAGLHGITGTRPVDPTLDAAGLYREAARREATVIVHHPGEPDYPWREADLSGAHGVEIWNGMWGFLPGLSLQTKVRAVPTGTRNAGAGYLFRSLHAMFWDKNAAALAFWHKALEEGQKLAPIAASDFHSEPQRLEAPCTLVWAPESTQEAFLEGLRKGRVILTTRPRGVRALLEADADGDGHFEAMPGDCVPPGSPVRITVSGLRCGRVRVFGAGGRKFAFKATGPDWSATFTHPGGPFLWARVDGALPGNVRAIAAPIYFT